MNEAQQKVIDSRIIRVRQQLEKQRGYLLEVQQAILEAEKQLKELETDGSAPVADEPDFTTFNALSKAQGFGELHGELLPKVGDK